MKISFGFGTNSGKKELRQEFFEEEYIEDYLEEEYSEEEYSDEEFAEEEYSAESDEEAADESFREEYTQAEFAIGDFYEEEYADEDSDEDSAEDLNEDSQEVYYYGEYSYEDDVPIVIPESTYEGAGDDPYDEEYYYEDDEDETGILPFGNLSGMADKFVMLGGAAILIIALIVGGVLLFARRGSQEENGFLNVGTQLAQIDVIGGSGLLAVSDAQKAAIEAAEMIEDEEDEGYQEEDYNTEVTVKLSMSSIEKDLKIKFINQDTGKLIGNVPFSIQVTDPKGKESLWSDDDMDGIIYKKKLDAGQYKVSVNAVEGEKYKKYGLPLGTLKVEVKSEIEYKKVDIANEVKSESQVDVSKEDTKINETVVESYLTDTVTWVESTATLVTYAEVAKANIADPIQLVMNGSFVRLSANGEEMGTIPDLDERTTQNPEVTPAPTQEPTTSTMDPALSPNPSETPSPSPSETPSPSPSETPSPSPSETPSPSPSETPSPSPSVSPSPSPSVSPSPSPSVSPSPSPSVSPSPSPSVSPSPSPSVSPSPSPSVSPKPTPKPMEVVLDRKTATIYMEEPLILNVVEVKNELEGAAITATSSDTNVATVTVDGKKITMTGVAPGTATITVVCTAEVKEAEGGNADTGAAAPTSSPAAATKTYSASATCTITVKSNPKKDTTTVLKDNQGREVYVLENNKYRVAHYADYYNFEKFFVKGEAKYTGWQTLNGKRYFFDASGKKITGEQVIQGVKYNFASDGSLVTGSGTLGIDVSKWNGNIDWTSVKNSGVSYVIIRCGYRGSSAGALIKDSKFEANIKGAINAGLKVGVYFFSQAIDKNEAVEEASMVLECVKNYKISYPIFLDVEASGGRADSISVATRTEVCKAFCETIQSYGYTAGIYANKNWFTEKINTNELSGKYKIWLAQYAKEPTYTGRYDMWQFKDSGKISGISGDVDMNLSYLGY